MKRNRLLCFSALVLFVLIGINGFSQTDKKLNAAFAEDIGFLSSDMLEGRLAGSYFEGMAAAYISNRYIEAGLLPMGDNNTYLQAFDFSVGKRLLNSTSFDIGARSLALMDDYYPLPSSAEADINNIPLVFAGFGIQAPDLNYNDYADIMPVDGRAVVIKMSYKGGYSPDSEFEMFSGLNSKIDLAIEKGAKAVLIANFDKNTEDPGHDYSRNVTEKGVPVIFITQEVYDDLLGLPKPEISLHIAFQKINRTGHNVLGYIDNKAANTIIIGGHFDHLGWGDYGSLYTGSKMIHNGADDNASGSSMVIQLAKYLAGGKYTNHNYLIIAFTGEELGLYGSKYFTDHPTIDLSSVSCMLNFDMVGRFNDEKGTLEIGGTGTSPIWNKMLDNNIPKNFKIKRSESGMGPSDHMSFYLKDLPVLFFFTGTHEDYHKPSDDIDKINYAGMDMVYRYVTKTVFRMLDTQGKIEFTKTKDKDNNNSPKFSVTLGVVPDYMFDGKGMRIDGVRDGKPADIAGILAGDVVIKMGPVNVEDMMSYMEALSKFHKGDTIMVTVLRGEETLDIEVTF